MRALHRSLVFVWSEVPKIPSYLVSWGFFAETSPESTRQLPLANDLSTASILGNTEPRVTCLGLGAIHAARALTLSTSPVYDYLADWRELKLEREVWRSVDLLGLVREGVLGRQKYYSGFYEPAAAASHASAWSPNKLIPG